MTPYDERAWSKIVHWRENRMGARARRVVPSAVRERLSRAGREAKDRFESLPGAAEFAVLFRNALRSLFDLGAQSAMASVRDGAIVEAYRKRGHPVSGIDDIRTLDLQVIDSIKPKLDIHYTAGATLEGATAGFLVSGGQIIAAGGNIFGVGAASCDAQPGCPTW